MGRLSVDLFHFFRLPRAPGLLSLQKQIVEVILNYQLIPHRKDNRSNN
jgi:hypothetical protein